MARTMSTDPFVNLPHLRERLIPADKSTLRLTPEALAVWDQRARDSGRPANWRLPDEVREASRNAVLGNRDASEDLWVFACGSLMWDPGIRFAEVRTAEVEGYQRRFTLSQLVGEAREIIHAYICRWRSGRAPARGWPFGYPQRPQTMNPPYSGVEKC